MRTLKKVLSLVLALALVLGVCMFSVSAKSPEVTTKFDDDADIGAAYKTAVDVMNAFGVIVGVGDNKFDPQGNLTRGSAAKIIAYLKGADKIVQPSTYDDTQGHWAESYIAFCSAQGITNGVGDNLFAPNATLSGFMFAKMLLAAVGYDAEVEQMTGAQWEVGVAVLMKKVGLGQWAAFDGHADLPREQACKLAFEAMTKANMTIREWNGTRVEGTAGDASLTVNLGGVYDVTAKHLLGTAVTYPSNTWGVPGVRYRAADLSIAKTYWEEPDYEYTEGFNAAELKRLKNIEYITASTDFESEELDIYFNGQPMTIANLASVLESDLGSANWKKFKAAVDKDLADYGFTGDASAARANAYAIKFLECLAERDYVGTVIELYKLDDAVTRVVVKQPYLAQVMSITKNQKLAQNNIISLEVYLPDGTVENVSYADNDINSVGTMYDALADHVKGDYLLVYFPGAEFDYTQKTIVTGDPDVLQSMYTDVNIVTGKVSAMRMNGKVTTKVEAYDADQGKMVEVDIPNVFKSYRGTVTVNGTVYTLATGFGGVINGTRDDGLFDINAEYYLFLDENGYVLAATPTKTAIDWHYGVFMAANAQSNTAADRLNGTDARDAFARVMVYTDEGSLVTYDTTYTIRNKVLIPLVDGSAHQFGDLLRYVVNDAGKVTKVEFATETQTGLNGVAWGLDKKGAAFEVVTDKFADNNTVIFLVPSGLKQAVTTMSGYSYTYFTYNGEAVNPAEYIKVFKGYKNVPAKAGLVFAAANTASAFNDAKYGTAMVARPATAESIEDEPIKNFAVLTGTPSVDTIEDSFQLKYTFPAIKDGKETELILLADEGVSVAYKLGVLYEIETDPTTGAVTGFFENDVVVGGKIVAKKNLIADAGIVVETIGEGFFSDSNSVAHYINNKTLYFELTFDNGIDTFTAATALPQPDEYNKTIVYTTSGTGSLESPLTVVIFYVEPIIP